MSDKMIILGLYEVKVLLRPMEPPKGWKPVFEIFNIEAETSGVAMSLIQDKAKDKYKNDTNKVVEAVSAKTLREPEIKIR